MPCKRGISVPRSSEGPTFFQSGIVMRRELTAVTCVALDTVKVIDTTLASQPLGRVSPSPAPGHHPGPQRAGVTSSTKTQTQALVARKAKRQVRKSSKDWNFYPLSLKLDPNILREQGIYGWRKGQSSPREKVIEINLQASHLTMHPTPFYGSHNQHSAFL